MSIWATPSTDEQPRVMLFNWAVFELPGGDRHLVGYSPLDGEGRATSKIQEYDRETRTVTTRTGRQYRLTGSPGLCGEAQYVWEAWKSMNRVSGEIRDVTEEYL